MAKCQSATRPPQHKDGEDYGGIEAGISQSATGSYTNGYIGKPAQNCRQTKSLTITTVRAFHRQEDFPLQPKSLAGEWA